MKRILHLITSLDMGGAERMLQNLLEQPAFTGDTSQVICMTKIGIVGQLLQNSGIPVRSLQMRPAKPELHALNQLVDWIRQDPPDLIQTWMYHADLLGALAARMAGDIPVVWGLHHTLGNRQAVRPSTRGVIWINALLSHALPRKVICCAESVRLAHDKVGYSAKKMIVIPNGIDTQQFHPNPDARLAVRAELGLDRDTPLIGLFARFHPQKDHQTFMRATRVLHSLMPGVHYILAGEGVFSTNEPLQQWVRASEAAQNIHLLGLRTDMPRLMAGVDLSCLSSAYGEALSLTLLESMASGIPCVATDVGDAALVVGRTGRIVPSGDAAALARQWYTLLNLPAEERASLGKAARLRIQTGYNIEHVARSYKLLYESLLAE